MISHRESIENAKVQRLSPNGHLIGWVVYGGLLIIGFFFGIVTGYEKPRTIMSQIPKDRTPPSFETASLKPAAASEAKPPAPPKEQGPVYSALPKNDPPLVNPGNSNSVIPEKPRAILSPKKESPKSQELVAVTFQQAVLPILRTHCLNCHGAGTGKPKGDVNLTSIANMMRSRGRKIIVPGKPNESDIYTSITEREMPDGGRPKPTEKELTVLRNWILSGAKPRRRRRVPSGQSLG